MRILYPSSFLKFTLLGFVGAAIPILAGLLYSVDSLDRLTRDSQLMVYQSAKAVNGSRDLQDAAATMERAARQYAILGDETLWSAYQQAHARFAKTGAMLNTLVWNGGQWQGLDTLIAREASLQETLAASKSRANSITARTHDFSAVLDDAKAISAQSHILVDQETSALLTRAEKERARVYWVLWGLAPLFVLMVIGVPLLIVKPIQQIDAAIRRLRDGNLNEPIKVNGPSDLEYLALRLDWMRQGLLDVEAEKSRFLRHLSHELKTPLTAVRESADLLWDGSLGSLTGAQSEVVSILRQNGQRLQKLIEDLLAYRTLLSDPHQIRLQPTRAREVVNRVLIDQRAALLAKNIRIENQAGDIEWQADPEKVRVILDNLLSNAIKFSPPGGCIHIRAGVEEHHVVLEVLDQGSGVSEEDRPHVFNAFYQGRQPVAASKQGTGLGLSIAKELAMALGGRIAVKDTPGHGACFQVVLPKAPMKTT
ncbi:MAG: HAMP domain-containing sensor histidine kinase [Parasulfuritortus sp.]|nr:HAMP domain-containing sensor histidine kinase [Parasulfuritortus sp.]